MKKFTKTAMTGLMVICLAIGANAQGFQLGIKALANVSSIRGFDEQSGFTGDLKSKVTMGAGIFATIKVSKIGVQPEVQLLKQGTKFDDGTGQVFNQKMTYLKVPLMINFYIIKQLHIEAGPYLGILLAAEQKLTSDPFNIGGNPVDNKDAFKTTDVGIAAGIGADVRRLNLSLRYMFGLSDINDVPSSTEKFKNGIFQFGIGISIINKD